MTREANAPLIECRGVVKRFHAFEHRTTSLQEFFLRRFRRSKDSVHSPSFHLAGIDLRVERDEALALIGANGSGKSTVLRLLAGIYPPTEGKVIRRGRVVPIIELGATFQPSLTGAENVALYAAALGLTSLQVRNQMEWILDFAGVAEFRDVPLKYYSSGMQSRLAFAIAACVRADVLLLDEILAVGDSEFRQRCLQRLTAFREGGGTLVIVSHDLDPVRALCNRGVWIEHGRIRAEGPAETIADAYEAAALAGT